MSNGRTHLPLEERLALAAQSKAASPEAAAALVRRFAELPAAYVFCGGSDVEAMNELTGEFWEDPRVDVDSYRGFCPTFQIAIEQDSGPGQAPEPCRSLWGNRVNNALILLGEMLLDQAMGRRQHKEVYHCLRMTLGQYLEALAGPDFRRSAPEAERFTAWRDSLLQEMDGGQPLAEALADILRRYIAGWEALGRLDHILRCLGGLALHEEEAGTRYHVSPCPDGDAGEGDAALTLEVSRTEDAAAAHRCRMALRRFGVGRYTSDLPQVDLSCEDPCGYFLDLARDYAPDLPDPGGEMEAKALRDQIFLPDWRYGPGVLRERAGEWPFPEFGPLLEECLDQDCLAGAMEKINAAVTDLYMLWVEPYLHM